MAQWVDRIAAVFYSRRAAEQMRPPSGV